MGQRENRCTNLHAILNRRYSGVMAELARAVGKDPNQTRFILYPDRPGGRGIGEMLARTLEKKLNLDAYALDLDPAHFVELLEGQRRMLGVASVRSGSTSDSNIESGPVTKGVVPLISWVQAGEWCEVQDPFHVGEGSEFVPCPSQHGERTFALRVRGNSMENPNGPQSFQPGDIIYVDPDKSADHKSLVVVRLEDEKEATFKQLLIDGERRFLMALNPSWPNRIMEIGTDAVICGVVIGLWRNTI